MFYVYVLDCGSERYIGFSTDLKRRFKEHNTGQSFSTKSKGNWQLIYYEAHTVEDDARRREKYFKTTQGRRALYRMLLVYNQKNSGNQRLTTGKKK